jgi:copper chaperone CopZ
MKMLVLGAALLTAAPLLAKPASKTAPAKAQMESLAAGDYTAQIKAIVCDGCGGYVKMTLEKLKGIDKVSVDQKTKTVAFHIQDGVTMKVADLQKALKEAAEEMGMGADYTLTDIKPATKA